MQIFFSFHLCCVYYVTMYFLKYNCMRSTWLSCVLSFTTCPPCAVGHCKTDNKTLSCFVTASYRVPKVLFHIVIQDSVNYNK